MINKIPLMLFVLALLSCSRNLKHKKHGINPIERSCELKFKIGDTILIKGVYTICMEYTSFQTAILDNCTDDFSMNLDFNAIILSNQLENLSGCVVSVPLVLRGVLRKKGNMRYGHLGSNNSEFQVLEIIEIGEVTCNPLE